MSKHTSTRRESRNGVSMARVARLPSGSLPLRRTWPISLCIGLAIGSIAVSADALAGGPTGGTVVGGAGSITQSGNETVINQLSQKLALNWETFNLKANESVLFNQPGRSAVALNRILDQNPSQIFGKINSNGQVFLINTHGIIFGATAQMNVGGLMASTLDLTPKDFLAGNYSLNAVGAGAGIVNHGLIQAASGGSVALVGGSVANDGVILANYGSINLDGAEHAVLDFDGNGLINIQITGELKQRLDDKEAAVSNTGTLKAEGGTVVLQASAAKDLFTNLVNNSGVIDASGISTDGGVVRLVGSGGNVVNSGNVAATGDHGGRIEVLSDKDVMVTGGTLDASGQRGGGAIRVGGGVRGGEGLPVAARSYVASGASLNADATGKGDGGSIAVFSRDNSVVAGSVSARGGIDGGNGGFVETSSHGALTVTGTPRVTARHGGGMGGNWLVDPNNIDIVAGSGNTKINAADPFVSTGDGASLGVDLITDALAGGASVTITTGTGGANTELGDITLDADLDYDGTGAGTLTLDAANDIVINNSISDSDIATVDSLNLSLLAGNNIVLNNDITLGTGSATLTATAGSISRTAGTISGDALTLTAGGTNGSIGASDAIRTNVSSIVFSANGNGAVNIIEGSGANVSGTAGSGNVAITSTTSDLAVVGTGIGTAGGAVTLEASGDGARINIGGGVAVDTTNGVAAGANVTLVADNADISGTINAGTAGIATIRQATAGRPISLGPDAPFPADPQLGVTAAELDLITANTIVIGDANSGDLSVNEAIAPAHATTLSLNTGGSIAQVTGATITVDTLTGRSVGTTALGEANHIGNLGGFTASSFSLTNADPLTLVGDVTTGGAQTYDAAILLGGNTVLTATNGAVNFTGTVDNADPTARNLTVNAGNGAVTFAGAVGSDATNGALGALIVNSTGLTTFANVAAASLVTNAGGGTLLGGNITTSGTQTYNDAVTLGGNVVLTTTNSAVKFAGTVDNATSTARALTVNAGTGALTFGGIVGGNATNGALDGLTTHSGSWSAGELNIGSGGLSVTTTDGGITQGGKFVVTGLSVFNSGSDAITLENAGNDFQGAVSATGGGVSITDVNDLAVATLSNGLNGEVKLIAGGVLSLPVGAIATGNADLTLASNGGPLITQGDLSGANVSLAGLGLTLNNVTTTGMLSLASDATIGQGPGSIITAGTLTGSSVGSTTLTGANQIGTLGSFTAANLALTNAQALTVTGPVDGGASTTLATTAGDLAINGTVKGTTTTLTSGGAITEGASGLITAGTLTGSSVGNTNLLRANQVTALGAFATGGDFAFNNAQSLTVNAAPSANGGAGDLTLTTTGASSDLVLSSNLIGNTVTLGAGRSISQTGGAITATTLTGSSVGSTTLNGANQIGTLGSFTAANLALTNAQALTVTGPVDGGASTTLATTAGDLAINGTVKGTTTTLTSGGAITEGASGLISAGTLTGSSAGSTTLLQANQVTALGAFTTGGDFAFNNAQSLTVNNAPSANGGLGNLTLTTTGASSDLVLASTLTGNTVSLGAGRNISQTAGAIQATTLTGSSVGSTTLTGANQIGTLGSFSAAGFNLSNAQALAVTGPVDGGASTTLATTAGNLAINGAVKGTTTTLTSAGAITEGAAGVITAGTLTGSSTGGTTLNGANQVGTLGSFTAASFALTNAQALAVTGLVSGGASTTLITTAGNLAINGAVGGATTTLTSAGAITEGAAGAITAGTLTGSSAGSTTLLQANHVGNLGAFTTGGDFAFNNAQSLTVSNAPSANGGAGDLTLTTTGASSDLALSSNLIGNTVTLGAGRSISQTGGAITATTLTGSSVGSTTLTGANQIGTLGSFTAANLALTNAQALTVTGPVDGGASTTLATTAGDLAINGTVKGTTTTLTSGGAITEGASGLITAGTLTGSSAGSTTLLQANQVTALGAFTTGGDFAFNNAQSLTVNNAPSANGGLGNLTLTTTGASSDLVLASTLTGNTVSLGAGRNISQTAGAIQATTLTGSSVGSTTLTGANQIGTLGSFSAAGFNLSNAQALAVTGPVDGGASTTLATTAGNLAINGAVKGTTTTLTSAGAITEGAAGVITAGTLTGSSTGGTTLNGANQVGSLGSFTAASFALTNAQALAVTGTVDGGAGTLLKTTSGNLTLNGAVKGAATTLTSAGTISQSATGIITAGTLTGSSAGGTTLNAANHVGNLGAFTTGGDFAFNNAQSLTVNNAPSANGGAGDLALTTTGASSDLILSSNLIGNTVTLGAGRNISQTGGAITATTLTGSSVGSTTLNGANQIGTLGSFTAANLALTNAQALTITGAVDGGASTALKTTAGNLAINGAVKGTTTTLNSGGAITQSAGGIITAGTLTGSSTGSTTLNAANHVGNLGAFATGGDFAFNNAQSLTVNNAPSANGGLGNLTLTTTGASSDLVLASTLTGNTVRLGAGRNISQTAGAIQATMLTGSSVGSTTLTGANHIGSLGSFTAANLALTNAQALAVTGPVDGGASTALKTTAGNLAINGAVKGTTTTLTSAGAITEGAAGVITAGTLTGSSTGGTTLNGANQVGSLGSFTAASFALTNAQALAVTGTVDGGAGTLLKTTSGNLTLNGAVKGAATTLTSAGTISQSAAGIITAGTLTGSSTGGTTLNAANHVGSLGAFTTGGDFAFNNAQSLTVNNAPSANGGLGNLTLTTTGASSDLVLASTLTGNTVSLGAGRNISQTAGAIQATTLTGSSVGSTTLTGANHIGTLGSFSAAGFNLSNAQALAVTGPVDGGASTTLATTAGDLAINGAVKGTTTTLTSAGAIIEGAAGSITANLLTGHSVGNTTLDGDNHINILGSFSADFSLTNGQTLTVDGPLDGGPAVALTTTAGDLIINGPISGTATALTSAGAIIEGTDGVITADTLSGSSAGSTSLLGANEVAALGTFTTGGDFAFNTTRTLTVNDAPSANGGAGNLTLTTTGASSDLILASSLAGNTVTLGSGRNISQTAGAITATMLTGSSVGSTTLTGANRIGTLGNFSAAGFNLANAQALAVTGPLDGGTSTTLKTTAGDLAINGAVKGTTTTLTSAGAITEGAGGAITAGTLTGSSAGGTTLNGANRIGTLGSFAAASFALSNAQALTVTGPLDGGASTTLKITAGDLAINGAVKGATTTLTSAGAITEGTGGAITAGTLTGSSTGATTLNGANRVGSLGSFTAAGFAFSNAQALAVTGPVNGGASTTLTTTAGDLAIDGTVSGTSMMLNSAGKITEGAGGVITAATLSGNAAGPTVLGSAASPNKNMVDTLGNFTSLAGFSMTNDKTLTLASVAGSSFTVNAGTSPFYLSVTHGDLFQLGTAPVYDGVGVWGSTGRMGTGSSPIYVVGTGPQNIANVGLPPAYFYAVDSSGNLLPLGGGFAINVPTISGAGSAQNGIHGDSYIDPSVITANYRSYGIVPSGVRLPPDQQSGCDPDQPDQAACQDPDALGMVMPWPNAPQ